jgi:outer membrane protein assembly factor BamA
MGTKLAWAALCIALLITVTATGTDSQRIGPAARSATLAIEGAEAFTLEAIREALFNELDVVAACDPNAPSETLTTVIADKAAAGYRAAGFCDVKVSVIASDDNLAMTIEEGGRYTNGEIEVSGNHHVGADQVKARLAA